MRNQQRYVKVVLKVFSEIKGNTLPPEPNVKVLVIPCYVLQYLFEHLLILATNISVMTRCERLTQ